MPPLPNVRIPWRIALGLALGLPVLAVMAQLQSILAGMHVDGGSSYRFGAMWGIVPDTQRAVDVAKTWQSFVPGFGFHSAEDVLWAFVLVDTPLLVIAYVLLLSGWLRHLDGALVAARAAPPAGLDAGELQRRTALIGAYLKLVRWSLPLVFVLALSDFVENFTALGLFYAAGGENGFWFGVLYGVFWLFTLLKNVLALVLLIAAVVTSIYVAFQNPERSRKLRVAFVVVRPHLVVIGLFAAAMFVSDQSADAFRRWPDEVWHGAAAAVLTTALALVILLTSRRLLDALMFDDEEPPHDRWFLFAGLALMAVAFAAHLAVGIGLGLVVLGGLLAATGGLSLATPRTVVHEPRVEREVPAREWLPPALAGAPLILLGLAALSATVPEIAYSNRAVGTFIGLAVAGLVIQAIGWVFVLGADRLLGAAATGEDVDAPKWHARTIVAAAGVVVVLWLAVLLSPWATGGVLGAHATFAGASLGLVLVVYLLVLTAEVFSPPRVFVLLRLKRTPVFLLLALWIFGAAFLDRTGSYYDARIEKDPPAAATGFDRDELTADEVFDRWKDEAPQSGAVPLVFVSAAGGGIRAAYWTGVVLSCVLEGDGDAEACRQGADASVPVFATSGISGGSLGLAAYVTHTEADPGADWYDRRLDDDYTAPLLSWALFVDLPLALVRSDRGRDRAEVLERAWERSWPGDEFGQGIYERWGTGREFPLLLLNGTKVQDGCRFNASVLSLSADARRSEVRAAQLVEDCLSMTLFERGRRLFVPPEQRDEWALAATDDLGDFLCPAHDVPLSTAVLMSARFPWVVPSGRVPDCEEGEAPTNLVDGGYFDTSGASPLVELYSELRHEVEAENRAGDRCIVPVFIQIDTGYSDVTQKRGGRPWESIVPLSAVKSARNAREANARQAAAIAFTGPIPGTTAGEELDRVAHISPRAHPGSKAPLGWTLSSTAREDLRAQLGVNAPEIEKVRGWFSGLSCT